MANRANKRSQDIGLDEWAGELEKLARRFDENAKTITELVPLLGLKWNAVNHLANKKVEAGEWERVYKRDRLGRIISAYRIKKV